LDPGTERTAQQHAVIKLQASARGMQVRNSLRARALRLLFTFGSIWGSPTRGTIERSFMDKAQSPADATWFERQRDDWLAIMLYFETSFTAILILGLVGLLGFGGLIAILLFPLNFGVYVDYWSDPINPVCNLSRYNASLILFKGSSVLPPRVDLPGMIMIGWSEQHWVAHWCTPAQWWFNICVKYFSFYFGLVNALPLPWTISIVANNFYPRRQARGKVGVDFYGKRTGSLWFHLPCATRKRIATINLFALIVQIPDCICHVIFSTYLSLQVWPGVLLTNIWLVLQIGCQGYASCLQGNAEARVRREQPGRFAPTLGEFLAESIRRWRTEIEPMQRTLCCGPGAFHRFLREEMQKHVEQAKRYGSVSAITGVHKEDVGMKRHQLYRTRSVKMAADASGKINVVTPSSRYSKRKLVKIAADPSGKIDDATSSSRHSKR